MVLGLVTARVGREPGGRSGTSDRGPPFLGAAEEHVLGKYMISDKPMTEEEWACERATVIDAEPAMLKQRNSSHIQRRKPNAP
jgi:hypothetical protein